MATSSTKQTNTKAEEKKQPRILSGFFFSFPLDIILSNCNLQSFIDKVKEHNLKNWNLLPGVSSEDTIRVWQPSKIGNLNTLPLDTYVQGFIAYNLPQSSSTIPFLGYDIFGVSLTALFDKAELALVGEEITVDKLYPDIENLDKVYFERFTITDTISDETRGFDLQHPVRNKQRSYSVSSQGDLGLGRYTVPWYFRGNEDVFVQKIFDSFDRLKTLKYFYEALNKYNVEQERFVFSYNDNKYIEFSLPEVLERLRDKLTEADLKNLDHAMETINILIKQREVREHLVSSLRPNIDRVFEGLSEFNQVTAEGQR